MISSEKLCDLLGIILDHRLPKFFDFTDFHFIAPVWANIATMENARVKRNAYFISSLQFLCVEFVSLESIALCRSAISLDQPRDSVLAKFSFSNFANTLGEEERG